jgi:hypothetical protein
MRNIVILFIAVGSTVAISSELLLYSDGDTFYGCLNCSRYNSDSICNRYGTYGSRYSSESIWNRYGVGSRYNAESPFSRSGRGLKVVDRSGKFYGYFSISTNGSKQFRDYLRELWKTSDEDHAAMRDSFCE